MTTPKESVSTQPDNGALPSLPGTGAPQTSIEGQPFRLLRYYSITSLIVFAIVAAILGIFYRQIAIHDLVMVGESKNMALTQSFANSLWPDFAPFVDEAYMLTDDELREHPETDRLRHTVMEQMEGLSVVKVKVYNLDGLTVFSTEAGQIGEDKSDNEGFQAARSGGIATELTHRDTFSAFEGEIEDRDVISSYVPIQPAGPNGPIEGVFEVYDDVTPLLYSIERTQRTVVIGVILVLATLYAALFVIVRHGDIIIKRQRHEVEEATRLKSQFLANVSHELRTPLNAIILYSQLVLREAYGELTEEQTEASQRILAAARRLLALIEDVLDISRIEAGKLEVVQDKIKLKEVLESVLKVAEPQAKARKLKIEYAISPDTPATITSDDKRLAQILQNLVDNAIKFTDEGTIKINVQPLDKNRVKFTVADTGQGIPEAQLDKIFDQFYQVDGSMARKQGGMGLGLNITRTLTEVLGGSISVTSEPGSGSTFIVIIPTKPTTLASQELNGK